MTFTASPDSFNASTLTTPSAVSFKVVPHGSRHFLLTYKTEDGCTHTCPAPFLDKAQASRLGRSMVAGERIF